jgi:hypothetical protein
LIMIKPRMMFNFFVRIWQRRRIIWITDMIFIAIGDKMLDMIPMHEIHCIAEMNEESSSVLRRPPITDSRLRDLSQSEFSRVGTSANTGVRSLQKSATMKHGERRGGGVRFLAIQIRTIPDGFNSGRAYYLRAPLNESSKTIEELVHRLSLASQAAKLRTRRKSLLLRSQDEVKIVQGSFAFQIIIAALIIAVKLILFLKRCWKSICCDEHR